MQGISGGTVILELDHLSDLENKSISRHEGFENVSKCQITYSEFFKNFLWHNEPCIIRQVTDNWPSQQLWTQDGKPNLCFLNSKYGSSIVPVANCDERYFDSQAKKSMTLREYTAYWRKNSEFSQPCLYLKDWHFMKEHPEEEIYTIPEYFASDWLNEYLLRERDIKDDYRFVYMGPRGSWTPFHSDVFSSFSWSVNICGKKKWVFFRPGSEERLRDKFGNLPYSVGSSDEVGDCDGVLVLDQGVGDAVFVPSGWYHQVWNIEDTISINHNWINGCNVDRMWDEMMKKLLEVEGEIADCSEMENWSEHCQLVLKAVHGMDVADFSSFIFYIARVRLQALQDNSFLKTKLSPYFFGRNHILFDLFSLQKVFQSMLNSCLPSLSDVRDEIISLIESIKSYRLCDTK